MDQEYPQSAVERAMKVQEVLLRAMSGRILWIQAAEILGISVRHMQRIREKFQREGYNGLFDHRRRKPSPRRVPLEQAERVLRLYRERYTGLNVRHFVEKLRDDHDIGLSYGWVKSALQGAGLVPHRSRRGPHRKRRPRRPLPGMLLHIDASRHPWLGEELPALDLVTVLDDATSEVYYARLVEEENTETVMAALLAVIQTKGVFCSLYNDRAGHFVYTPPGQKHPDRSHRTQVGRALEQLGIEMIPAHSPQARGRCERLYGTWQGRLPQELKLRELRTIEAANEFIGGPWLEIHRKLFGVPAGEPGSAFVPYRGGDLKKIFSIQEERQVGLDNTVRFDRQVFQIGPQKFRFSLAKCRVLVCRHLDGTVSIHHGPHELGRYSATGDLLTDSIQRVA
jgi:transposase